MNKLNIIDEKIEKTLEDAIVVVMKVKNNLLAQQCAFGTIKIIIN